MKKVKKVTISLPEDVIEKGKGLAEKESRSFSKQIAHLIITATMAVVCAFLLTTERDDTEWIYSGTMPTGLGHLNVSDINWTYSGDLPKGLQYFNFNDYSTK